MNQEDQKKIDDVKNSGWSFFIEKRSIAWLVVITSLVMGMFALNTLPREIQPEINIPIVAVATFLPGANPSDTESLVTEPIEKQLGTISEIKKMSSTSGFGNSTIVIEFNTKADIDKKLQEVKDGVEKAKNSLPKDAITPMVLRAKTNDYAIITYSIVGDLPVSELTKIAKDIKGELEKISGISSVEVVGGQEEEIHVTLDQQKLENLGLDLQTVVTLIKYSNINLPLGVVAFDELNYSLRIDNRYQNLEDIRNISIFTTRDGSNSTVLLKDISRVEKAYPDQNVITKFSENQEKSLPTVSVQVFKKDGGNILKIADETKLKIDDLSKNKIIPEGVKAVVSNDNSAFIREDLGTLTESGIETTILIIIILFLALGWKQGLIAGLSVPLSFLMTFIYMNFAGLSINSLPLFALVIALGIAVDVSIVIMQGIHDNLRKGFTPKESAFLAIDTYKWPLITGTMTTIAAFFPMLLVSGLIGEFLRTLPIVISTTLLVALFLGFTVTPSLAAKFLDSEKVQNKQGLLEPILRRSGEWFHTFIEKVVERRSMRVLTISILLILFGLSLSLPLTGILKTQMFPATDQNYFIVKIEAPAGTILEKTQKIVDQVEERLNKVPEIKNYLSIIGSGDSPAMSGGIRVGGSTSENSNIANVTVNLVEKKNRKLKSYEIADIVEADLKKSINGKITVVQLQEGPPGDAAITARITGKDLNVLKDLSLKIKQIIAETANVKNVDTSLKEGLNEFKFVLDRDALNYHGLAAAQVAIALRNILQGADAGTIKLDEEDTNIVVNYNLNKINGRTNISFHDIENFEITSPKGYSVNLSQLGTYSLGRSPDQISHEDQKRILKVTGDTEKDANVNAITIEIQDKVSKLEIPKGYEINFGGDMKDIQDSFNELFRSMFVGIILIAFMLVLEFNSFKQTFLLLLSLPMGLIGVFPGLLLLGLDLSFPAFLGIVALAGVVVNHAIVLIDRINENRRNKMKFHTSIAEATSSRFEPIFMTTAAAIIGILPLALTNEFWAGLGFSLLFGLLFSTLLTLVTIPIVYYTFELKNAKKNGEL